jgi:hypothetical protein
MQGLLSLPGSLAAYALNRPIDAEEEFGGSMHTYKTSPIAYYYGNSDILEKSKLYSSLLLELAAATNRKLQDKLGKFYLCQLNMGA